MGTFIQDVRYGLRMLRKNPGFTAVAVVTLALGIGANTAIFSLINAVMLKTLPVKNPEQLVVLGWRSKSWPRIVRDHWGSSGSDENGGIASSSFPYSALEEFHTHNEVLTHVFGFRGDVQINLTANGKASLASAEMVSGDYFSGLGISPMLGRAISEADDRAGAPAAAVISYRIWERHFASDRSVVGKGINLNSFPFTIVGVAPPEFFGTEPGQAPDLWVPLSTQPQIAPRSFEPGAFHAADNYWLLIMGRLKPGVSAAQARAALDVLFQHVTTAGVNPPLKPEELPHITLKPGNEGLDELREEFSKPLFILMSTVSLVLLIACANVANLLLARAQSRQREIAVRSALGAGRARLVRQLLTESVLLALLGGTLGLAFAYWGSQVLMALISTERNRLTLDVQPDLHVLGFTAAVSLLTGILFGVTPALRAMHVNLTPALKESPGNLVGGPGGRLGLGRSLVVAQMAMSLLLLVGAGLFVRTLMSLKNVQLGFNQENLLLFGIDPTLNGYAGARLTDFYQQLLDRMRRLPGVQSATLSQHMLIGGGETTRGISVKGYKLRPGEKIAAVWCNRVGPGFLDTLGIPLLLGRDIARSDTETTPKVAVVNEAMAHRFFGDANPVGLYVGLEGPAGKPEEVEIVGVAQNAKYNQLRRESPPTIYTPYLQEPGSIGAMHFNVRTALYPADLIPTVRRAVQEANKDIPLFDVLTENQVIDESLLEERLFAKLTGFFGLIALGLACVGVYGVMAYSVIRRTTEIGIRMALGAQHAQVLWMVLRESLILVGIGVAIGLGAALAATPVVSSLLFGVQPTDPATIAAATFLMLGVAAFAAYLPAHRATRVDPMVALRYE